MVDLGKIKLKTRITIRNLKRAKEMTGIELTGQDPGPMLEFATDPLCVMTVVYALYCDQFENARISEEDLEELLGPQEIAELRMEVTEQMKSFSNFWKIVSTEMEDLQSGNTDLLDRAAKVQAVQAVSGPLSSQPPSA